MTQSTDTDVPLGLAAFLTAHVAALEAELKIKLISAVTPGVLDAMRDQLIETAQRGVARELDPGQWDYGLKSVITGLVRDRVAAEVKAQLDARFADPEFVAELHAQVTRSANEALKRVTVRITDLRVSGL